MDRKPRRMGGRDLREAASRHRLWLLLAILVLLIIIGAWASQNG